METETEKCNKCLNAVGDNIFETNEGEYICQDCFENENERIEMLIEIDR